MTYRKLKPATPELLALFRAELIKAGVRYEVADRLRSSFAICRDDAIAVYQEIIAEMKANSEALKNTGESERIAAAKAYVERCSIGRIRLARMFAIPARVARDICGQSKPTRARKCKPKVVTESDMDAAMAYLQRSKAFATPESIADRFGVSVAWARSAIEQVSEPKNGRPKRKFRTVRRFRDLSGTDATADRVRYPSGIGFGVVEVVR
jgi:hypothetical protein